MKSEKLKVESASQKTDSITETVMVALYDTVREVTTITIRTNTLGDTLRIDRITERDNSQLKVESEKLKVVSDAKASSSDTLIVHDTVVVINDPSSGTSLQGTERSVVTRQPTRRQINTMLFWIFAIIVALSVLVYLIKRKTTLILLFLLSSPLAYANEIVTLTVTRVVDGDTFEGYVGNKGGSMLNHLTVRINGIDVAGEMLRNGLAWYYKDYDNCPQYAQLEATARSKLF